MGWYEDDHLTSEHWLQIKETVYKLHPYCQICGKRFDLNRHHLRYDRLGTKWERFDVRVVCYRHHMMCHYVFWFIRLPRTRFWLTSRYYFVLIRYKLLYVIWNLAKWFYYSYRIERSRKRLRYNN